MRIPSYACMYSCIVSSKVIYRYDVFLDWRAITYLECVTDQAVKLNNILLCSRYKAYILQSN